MEGHPRRQYSRRTLLKLALGVSLALVGGGTVIHRGWLPEDWLVLHGGEGPLPASGSREPPTDGRPVVAVVRGDDPATMVRGAVALAGGLDQAVPPGATVLVKPNLTIPSSSGLGNVTNSRVLQATIELCQEAGAGRILVGDGSGGGDSGQIMRQAGYEPVLKATGATFVDLNRDAVVTRRLAEPDALPEYFLDRTAVEVPVLISLAVLKVHNSAVVSLTCKNLMGITARQVYGQPRQALHDAGVQRVIADLVRLRTPDFAIIDGIVGLEGDSPMHGTPVPMNLIVAGRNPVSVDAVGTAIMGIDPWSVEHLTRLADRSVGVIDQTGMALKGSAISDVRRSFRRQ